MHEAEEFNLGKQEAQCEIVVDRIVVSDKSRSRLFDSTAFRLAGYAIVDVIIGEEHLFRRTPFLCCGFWWAN